MLNKSFFSKFSRRRFTGLAVTALFGLVLTSNPGIAWADEAQDAKDFLQNLAEESIDTLGSEAGTEAEHKAAFKTLLNQNFDLKAISRFVLGRYWRAASEEEQQAFTSVFEDLLADRFVPLFKGSSTSDFSLGTATLRGGDRPYVIVASKVKLDGGTIGNVNWRIVNKDGKFLIQDVIAEGASMAITLRSEYNSVLRQNNGSVTKLVEDLRRKVK
ncbi:MAG: ABC transporter substrate-binding protein [Pseudomonadota bacterium]